MNTSIRRYPGYVAWLWLVPALLGAVVTALIMVVLPADRTIDGLGEFAFKVLPLIAAVLTIALFPKERTWLQWLLLLGYIFYMGFLDSAFIIQVLSFISAAQAGSGPEQFPELYRFTLFINAYTVLLALFAFRLGGGSAARVIKLGLSAILILISGLNDLTFWAMYDWPDGVRPEVFAWASHVIIFTGAPPTVTGMLIFIAIHLLLVAGVMLLPIQRWLDRLAARWQVPAGERADPASTGTVGAEL